MIMTKEIFVYELCKKFRLAIDNAKINNEFTISSCLFTFPKECCDITCDLLGQYLFENNIHTYQINAQSKYDSQRRHVWLKFNNDTVIDITADQFIGKDGFPQVIESVYMGRENAVHKIFSKNRKKEKNTSFVDPKDYNGFGGTPDFRQKRLIQAYKIIKRYLRD